ncbi:maltokinase N-terminal cap-like domain-containing protein [Streptomyces mirabilis]
MTAVTTAAVLTSTEVRRALAVWLPRQRWFAGTGSLLSDVSVTAVHRFTTDPQGAAPFGAFVLVRARDSAGTDAASHLVPLGLDGAAPGCDDAAVVATVGNLTVYDALQDPRLVNALIRHTTHGLDLDGVRYRAEAPGCTPPAGDLPVRPLGAEQSNSSVVAGEQYILKVFRRLGPGPSPDLMLHRMLRDAGSAHVTPLIGAVEDSGTGTTYATLQRFLPQATDGWAAALTAVSALREDPAGGDFTAQAQSLGRAVAAVHRDLARAAGERMLRPEDYRRLSRTFLQRLERSLALAERLAPYRSRLRAVFTAVAALEPAPHSVAHLTHGDLHLGQTLRTAEGWLLLDFEGEPLASDAERARRHSPLRDVAGMLRSFDYAAHHGLVGTAPQGEAEGARSWAAGNRQAFLEGYVAGGGRAVTDCLTLLRAYELDKAVYEVLYETQHRPSWAWIPLRALERDLSPGLV